MVVALVVATLSTVPMGPLWAGHGADDEDQAAERVLFFRDPRIQESSGLIARVGSLITTNDSGDRGRLFTVDSVTGVTSGLTLWGQPTSDVEALAPAEGNDVWVGDIGDNKAQRESVTVFRVEVRRGFAWSESQSYELVYADGPRDAEALLVHPRTGRLYVASKRADGGVLYQAPERLSARRENALTAVAPVGPVVTDGSFFPDGKFLILRGYDGATVYSFPDMQTVGDVPLPQQRQGEGIAVAPDGDIFVSSEGPRAPVYRVELPPDVAQVVGVPDPSSPAAPTPPAGSDTTSDPEAQGSGLPMVAWVLLGVAALVAVVGAIVSRRKT